MENPIDETTTARERALDAMAAVATDAVPLVRYVSHGRVAIIGGPVAAEFAPRLSGALKPLVVLTEGAEEPGVPQVPLGGRPLSIEGHLGDFILRLGEPGTPGHEKLRVDLVLDLQASPLLDMPAPPPGYLTASEDELSLAAAQAELEALVGTFEKPLFVDHDAHRCAHAQAGILVCTRCLDACPARAIRSEDGRIVLDHDRCQGCGICATTCPSGAMRYQFPTAEKALEQVKALLQGYRRSGGEDPVVVLYEESERSALAALPPDHLPLEVESIVSRGLEFWFGALAYGARQLRLLGADRLAEPVAGALAIQLDTAAAILQAMGYPAGAVSVTEAGERMPPLEPAGYAPCGDKRQLFYLALDHLQAQSLRKRPLVQLPAGAPFGTAQVDAERCTLCKSCVGACPGQALQDLSETPAIGFVEANCLQCGTCTRICPEDAIAISPRLLLNREQRQQQRILHREEPFECIACGKPFATRAMVMRMQQALQGHWMFRDESARRRLQMCDQCRVVDLARDPDAMAHASGLKPGH